MGPLSNTNLPFNNPVNIIFNKIYSRFASLLGKPFLFSEMLLFLIKKSGNFFQLCQKMETIVIDVSYIYCLCSRRTFSLTLIKIH